MLVVFVCSSRVDHTGVERHLVTAAFHGIMHYFGFFMMADLTWIDSVLVISTSYLAAPFNVSLSGCSYEFVAYNVLIWDVGGYPAEKLAAVRRQKAFDGPVLPIVVSLLTFKRRLE